jgi:peptidoglycan/LPS O-acetylase OafA/YrhL
MKRLDQLTFTRFWALLLVIIYHGGGGIYINWIDHPWARAILFSAPTAVSYLYILSGFVMSIVYYRPAEKFDIGGYWTARFVRIYPLYILSFILVCYFYLDYIARIKPQKVLANIFVLQAWWPPYSQSFNYASWSMTVEFFFYAIFPFFTLWAYRQSTRKLIWASLILWFATQLVHFVLWIGTFPAWQEFIVYNPIFHLNSFIVGAVGGIWFVRQRSEQAPRQAVNILLIFGSLVLISSYIILSSIYPRLPHDLQPMSGLLAPFLILFIVALALDRTKLSSVLAHPWLATLGETAFALYILHVPVIWLYERALFSSSLPNPNYILSVTYLPLMISVGLIAYFFIDPLIRNWMKNVLKRVSMPLLILDLAIIAFSVYFSFRFRFGEGREFNSYRTTSLLMFWSAFLGRTSISVALNALNPAYLYIPLLRLLRSLSVSVTAGSLVVAAAVYLSHAAGWIENFPRSIFVIDWMIVLALSIFVRYVFRWLQLYKASPVPA